MYVEGRKVDTIENDDMHERQNSETAYMQKAVVFYKRNKETRKIDRMPTYLDHKEQVELDGEYSL